MTAGVIFVFAILILGGVIAVVSDRLGMKVGKARLSLFKMRPRKTAVVVTIVTGTVLSALTLGTLFAASKPLRRGVFRMDQIQERLNQTRKDLTQTTDERDRVEAQLSEARDQLNAAQNQLSQINQSLDKTNDQATQTQTELATAQEELEQAKSQLDQLKNQLAEVDEAKAEMESELNQKVAQLQEVSQQKETLRSEIEKLKTERQNLIKQREQVEAQIQQRDQEIAARDEELKQQNQEIEERDKIILAREETLKSLEVDRQLLEEQTASLEKELNLIGRDFRLLREGSVALRRGEILASALVKTDNNRQSQAAINQLLKEANSTVVNSIQLGNVDAEKEQVIQIPQAEVEALIEQIDNGQDYVIQIISSANYLVGESRINVFSKVEPNRLLFTSGEIIAKNSLNPAKLTNEQLQQRLQEIIDASEFRARFVGVVDGIIQIGDEKTETILSFFQQLQNHQQPIELQAVAAQDTYTIGPLKLNLLARQNGSIVFSTRDQDVENFIQKEEELEKNDE
ncbi:MAG: DUF3084 domain-containing protein [Microcoleaceae cyanobacterium]